MSKLYRDKKTGKKLYPVCSWEKNQHKLYNAYDRIMVAIYEDMDNGGDNLDKLYDAREGIEKAMNAFDSCVINGLVYATWEDGNLIKDIICAYDLRHDFSGNWK